MSYRKGNVPSDPKDLPAFLNNELQELQQQLNAALDLLAMVTKHAAPSKLYDGLVVMADGTDWNPGSGQGLYVYYGSAWHPLKGTPAGSNTQIQYNDAGAFGASSNLTWSGTGLAVGGTADITGATKLNNILSTTQATLSTTTGAVTVDWSVSNFYVQNEPTGAITYTFTAPPSPTHLQILINSDGTSTAYGFTFPGTVIWYVDAWSTTITNKRTLLNFYYDGTNYHATAMDQA